MGRGMFLPSTASQVSFRGGLVPSHLEVLQASQSSLEMQTSESEFPQAQCHTELTEIAPA